MSARPGLRSRCRLGALTALVCLAGCGDGLPDDPAGLLAVARSSRDAAKSAMQREDADAAAEAAERAAAADERAAGLAAAGGLSKQQLEAVAATAEAAEEALRFAEIAAEVQRLKDLTGGVKARIYTAARSTALRGTFEALALAAEQADKHDPGELPQGVQDAALAGARLAGQLNGRPLEDDQPDWKRASADLSALGQSPPPELGLFLAVAFLVSGRDSLALYEIESVDPKTLKSPDQQAGYHALRGLILLTHDLPHLASAEFEILAANEGGALEGPELQAGAHLLLAAVLMDQGEYRRADLELSRSMKAWPDNPVGVFLTGERLAADGKYIEAADSLEQRAAGTSDEWLAKRIAERARELRDQKGEAEPLFHDSGFLIEVATHYVLVSAKDSAPARKLQEAIETARGFGRQVLEKLPGE